MGANAQTSVPAFTSGQVLTAAQVTQINTGIPVFASSTERDAAFGGSGEKTLAEGQMAYLEDTNSIEFYNGASWKLIYRPRTAFTPTWANLTVGNATVQAFYSISGDMMTVELDFVWGSTTSVSGTVTQGLPSGFQAITSDRLPCAIVEYRDTGTANYTGSVFANTDGLQFFTETVNATYPVKVAFSGSVPFSWTTSDEIRYIATFNWQAV